MSTSRPSLHFLLYATTLTAIMNSILTSALMSALYSTANIPPDGWWLLLGIPQNIPPFILMPRFILNLRKLYARDVQGRRGADIDTAFGLTSVRGQDAPATSAITFVHGGQNGGLEQGEEIQLEEREIGSAGSGA